jgi:hypothetical protein
MGGHRELVPSDEPTRVELIHTLAKLDPAVAAALAHRGARRRLNELATKGGSLTFDHPAFKDVQQTERRLDEELEPFADYSVLERSEQIAIVEYHNHRGETRPRRIVPEYLWHGQTEWHKEPQWLLRAFDMEKLKRLDFAMGGVVRWSGAL